MPPPPPPCEEEGEGGEETSERKGGKNGENLPFFEKKSIIKYLCKITIFR